MSPLSRSSRSRPFHPTIEACESGRLRPSSRQNRAFLRQFGSNCDPAAPCDDSNCDSAAPGDESNSRAPARLPLVRRAFGTADRLFGAAGMSAASNGLTADIQRPRAAMTPMSQDRVSSPVGCRNDVANRMSRLVQKSHTIQSLGRRQRKEPRRAAGALHGSGDHLTCRSSARCYPPAGRREALPPSPWCRGP
jgi:hypothetical protein